MRGNRVSFRWLGLLGYGYDARFVYRLRLHQKLPESSPLHLSRKVYPASWNSGFLPLLLQEKAYKLQG